MSMMKSMAAGAGSALLALAFAHGCNGDALPPPNPVAAAQVAGAGTAGARPAVTAGASAAGAMATTPPAASSGQAGAMPQAEKGSPTFSAIHEEILVGRGCAGGSLCHGGSTSGKLNLSQRDAAYTALVGVPAMGMNLTLMPPNCVDSGQQRVIAGDPDNSLLMQKLLGTQQCGAPMPPNPPLLMAAEVEQIRMWIAKGALND
jgi:hypothetical protein